MVSKHDEFDDFLNDDDEGSIVDTRADGRLLRVPLNRLSPNGVNPRKDFGTKAELEDFGRSLKRRQLQALPVVTRTAYLKQWPDHEELIGNVDFVIVSGERRFRGASAVGLPALECVINDDVAETRRTFLDAVVSENIDRQNFDAIEEANAVDVLVQAFGTARAVAEHYERGDAWVSQRRILLRLAPEAQDLVRRRDLPLEHARKLGKLVKDHSWSSEEQLEWWAQQQQARQAAAAGRKASKKNAAPVPAPAIGVQPQGSGTAPSFTAVKTQPAVDAREARSPAPVVAVQAESAAPPPVAVPEAAGVQNPALNGPEATAPGQTLQVSTEAADVPEQRVDPLVRPPVKMPWDDGVAAMKIVFWKLDEEQRRLAIGQYLEMVGGPEAAAADLAAAVSPAYRQALVEHLSSEL
ncbi:hypothetical protein [Streptomyces sp. NBC_00842]|uniref:ParB/RepB/Spo0J family partition protein n=1 Tax=Streptomyces sp. NBC_00842 TaxID=2975848 RepID=UPI002F907A0E|nr:ParB N-terminal domain-containing protein [Streptomyces sp. NBC_00842]